MILISYTNTQVKKYTILKPNNNLFGQNGKPNDITAFSDI